MDNLNVDVTAAGDSPRGGRKYRYALLQSPTGLSPRSTLPFLAVLVLSFVIGAIFGGAWHKIDLPASPDSLQLPSPSASFLRKPDVDATDSLAIAWLMSFPNSGTSYTSYMVRKVTGKNTASNYGTENLGADGTSVGVFPDSPGGPFWTDPLKYDFAERGYLLTKTHCGGRCDQCKVKKYVENHQSFSRQCFEGHRVTKDTDGEPKETLVSYSKDRVKRAVHLIRDPFDNVVSRFHLAYKHYVRRNQTREAALYPTTKEGFLRFCRDQGRRFRKEEEKSKYYQDIEGLRDIPCHADFFRYIQWHNLAFTTTWDLGIPTMILHYENYTNNFNRTKEALLDFLEQEDRHDPPAFVTGKTYREYFTDDEVKAVYSMFSTLALAKTLDHTKHYFIQ